MAAIKTSPKEDLAAFLLVESLDKKEPLTSQQAMVEAGFSASTAKSNCHKLTKHRFYKAWQAKRTENAFSSKDSLEKRLHGWLENDITDFISKDGTLSLLAIKKLPRELRICIESIKETRHGVDVKLVSKEKALENLCKINGLFISKHEHTGEVGHIVNVSQQTILALHELEKAERLKKMKEPNNRISQYVSEN